MIHRFLFTVACALTSSGLIGCGDRSVDFYYENPKEANQVVQDCVMKKGVDSLKSNSNCSNAVAAIEKRAKDIRAIQRKADEAALARFGQAAGGK